MLELICQICFIFSSFFFTLSRLQGLHAWASASFSTLLRFTNRGSESQVSKSPQISRVSPAFPIARLPNALSANQAETSPHVRSSASRPLFMFAFYSFFLRFRDLNMLELFNDSFEAALVSVLVKPWEAARKRATRIVHKRKCGRRPRDLTARPSMGRTATSIGPKWIFEWSSSDEQCLRILGNVVVCV